MKADRPLIRARSGVKPSSRASCYNDICCAKQRKEAIKPRSHSVLTKRRKVRKLFGDYESSIKIPNSPYGMPSVGTAHVSEQRLMTRKFSLGNLKIFAV